MTYQGTTYGLPLNFKVITLIYNKKLVPTPPKTTAELAAMAKKLTNAKAGKFGLAYWYSDFYYHAALMNGFGGGVFAGRKPTLNSPQNVASLDYLLKWINQGLPAGRAVDGADHLAVQRGQGGDGLLRPLVPRRDRQGDRLRPGAAAHDLRGRQQADAAVDHRRGGLRRRAVEEQGRRLRARSST